ETSVFCTGQQASPLFGQSVSTRHATLPPFHPPHEFRSVHDEPPRDMQQTVPLAQSSGPSHAKAPLPGPHDAAHVGSPPLPPTLIGTQQRSVPVQVWFPHVTPVLASGGVVCFASATRASGVPLWGASGTPLAGASVVPCGASWDSAVPSPVLSKLQPVI